MASKSKPARLSRERIVQVALEAVEQEGVDALSMRRLAQRLDVWPMSIYTYFRDKDELLDALAESAVEAVPVPSRRASWRTQMRELLHDARRVLGTDASGLSSRLPRAILSPGLLRISDAGLAILERAGFSKRDAAGAWRALLSYTFGFATLSVGGNAEEARRRTRAAIAALPEDGYPALHAAAAELAAALAEDDEFDRGLERLLDGLAASLS
jgi:AcrR family transcriptional regulator